MYYVDCICGHPIESKATILTCAHCQRVMVIEGPARDNTADRAVIIRGLKLCGEFESAATEATTQKRSLSKYG